MPPKTIGRFTLLNEIGRGSYGVVYAAHDPVLGREVAIKVIPLASEERYRTQIEASFLREAKSAGGMSHPSIVTIYDAGKTDALAYIAMERLHGQDLHEYLASGNRMSPRQAAAMMMRVADAIHYANKRGLVHRDIKPSQHLPVARPETQAARLRHGAGPASSEPAQRGSRQLVGTPNYMSPEQARGASLDARSDIFSLGTILYELLSGRRAFDGRTIDETLDQVLIATHRAGREDPSGHAGRPRQIVRRAMSRDPADRYQKASELRNALAEFVDGSRRGRRPMRRRSLPASGPGSGPRAVPRSAPVRVGPAGCCWASAAPPCVAARCTRPGRRARGRAGACHAPLTPPSAPRGGGTTAGRDRHRGVPQDRKRRRHRASARRSRPRPATDGTVTIAVAPWGEVVVDGRVQRRVAAADAGDVAGRAAHDRDPQRLLGLRSSPAWN